MSWRQKMYQEGCRHARAVGAESQWVKNDIIRQYGIDEKKICVIPRGSPTDLYGPISSEDLVKTRQKFLLPEQFVFYPAQTWPHKNHIRLIEAIRLLRDRRNLRVNLVCCGRQNDFWPSIEKHIDELGVKQQIFFLGFVSPTELRALYKLAQFLVFPSLFEGGGFPLVEGFRENLPITCSSVTSLLDYGGDAVLFFDPVSIESMAEAIHRMVVDSTLREILRQRGAMRISLFSWERTATTYRALYRKVAGRPLSADDQDLLCIAQGTAQKT